MSNNIANHTDNADFESQVLISLPIDSKQDKTDNTNSSKIDSDSINKNNLNITTTELPNSLPSSIPNSRRSSTSLTNKIDTKSIVSAATNNKNSIMISYNHAPSNSSSFSLSSSSSTEDVNSLHKNVINQKDTNFDFPQTNKKKLNSIQKKLVIPFHRIILAMLDQVSGKNHIAKVIQFTIRLLLMYSDHIIKKYSNNNIKLKNSLFLRTNLLLSTQIFYRLKDAPPFISLYRQFLRVGKTPFRFLDFYNYFSSNTLKNPNAKNINNNNFPNFLFSDKFLSLSIGTYYGIFDEISLFFKLGILKDKKLKKRVSYHESFSWYLDILFTLKNQLRDYSILQNKKQHLSIEKKIKLRTLYHSRDLVSSTSISSNLTNSFSFSSPSLHNNRNPRRSTSIDNLKHIDEKLVQLDYEIKMMKLSLLKTLCDFYFDSVDLFNLKFNPFFYTISGFGAGFLSALKVYIETKRDLENK
ncbi:uncharacterized protein ASCRUDRAFT_100646 [Ascoidea rubescens DSM 1968]|uniref:Peroxisomal biogenesis factor 11 n=1 Tax=Ascoidea rubescens DSM 1968 TaxID=1344418 RepID=A0A1D2VQS0_9ASCO|nr:hypothetical protein ASCRUDRAFT_100646 [Ascoidea rubescens DSM 1968]ODV63954.1 hypothetical protein ASCRUDRAFT_100646 [Ascoidea rubescens DSM 1968]